MPAGRPRKEHITSRQAEVMQEIVRFFKIYGYLPTMQQLADRFGIAAPTIYELIQGLVARGYLAKAKRASNRSYKIKKEVEPDLRVKAAVPLLGAIPCGVPAEPACDTEREYVLIDVTLTRASNVFALRLDGDSMRELGYETNDIVIVRVQQMAENNDIVAAFVNGKATLKRLIYTPDRIALKAENPGFATIEIKYEDEFRIVGKVIRHISEKEIEYGQQ
jgi:repressor LexA